VILPASASIKSHKECSWLDKRMKLKTQVIQALLVDAQDWLRAHIAA